MSAIDNSVTMNNPAAPTLERISAIYPSLNEAERRVADMIRSNPDIAKGASITRVAELSGVSQTTVLRFSRSLGFEGYQDFKLGLVEEMGANRKALPEEHSDVAEDDSLDVLTRKVLTFDMQAIANTMHTMDTAELGRAIDALLAAGEVAVFGSGASLSVAMEVYYRLLRSGIRSRMSVDSHMQAINAGLLGPGNVGIAVSYSGETRDVLDCAALARDAGATVICITNFPKSSLARVSNIRLVASTVSARWIHDAIAARLAQLAMIDALCVGISLKNNQDTLPILTRIEKAAARKRKA